MGFFDFVKNAGKSLFGTDELMFVFRYGAMPNGDVIGLRDRTPEA